MDLGQSSAICAYHRTCFDFTRGFVQPATHLTLFFNAGLHIERLDFIDAPFAPGLGGGARETHRGGFGQFFVFSSLRGCGLFVATSLVSTGPVEFIRLRPRQSILPVFRFATFACALAAATD